MAIKRMDNVGIVVEDLEGTIDFFRELGLELEGRATIEGTIDFFRELGLKGGPRSKENGPDVSLDWAISMSRLP